MKSFKDFINTKPIYIRRNVLNAAEFLNHHINVNGFTETITEEELHCTIMFSRGRVDWNLISPQTDTLEISCTSDCGLTVLGKPGSTAFVQDITPSPDTKVLKSRWKELMEIGCTWNYDGYKPHISISYKPQLNLRSHIPFTGTLILGPEIMQELDLNWKKKLDK